MCWSGGGAWAKLHVSVVSVDVSATLDVNATRRMRDAMHYTYTLGDWGDVSDIGTV